MEQELRAIEVVDIEKDILKELLLSNIYSLKLELQRLNSKIQQFEAGHKNNKNSLQNKYAELSAYNNSRYQGSLITSKLGRLMTIYNFRIVISQYQSHHQYHKKELTKLYLQKREVKLKLTKYNLIADMNKIMLYK